MRQSQRKVVRGGWIGLVLAVGGAGALADAPELVLSPGTAVLRGASSRQQVIATGRDAEDGRPIDLTRRAAWRSETPGVVAVEPDGVVRARGDGEGTVVATFDGREARATFRVEGTRQPPRVTLEREILPILTRAGCNAGACHGKARGQNGFGLSLLGFDPAFDLDAITREARGRRLFPPAPEQSLLLLKATAAVPHGGGRRLEPGSPSYEAVLRWIATGTPRTPATAAALEKITVTPPERSMSYGGQQQLVVTAHYAGGHAEDVTHLAAFQSSEGAVVAVDPAGRVTAGPIAGEAVISARFRGLFANCEVTIPLPGRVPSELYARLPRANLVDGPVWAKLQRLGITPSEPAADAVFLRRASLDIIGRLPTADEARSFLNDATPTQEKRARLVDALLERPEYADHWANKWMDLLRPNPYRVGIKAVWNLDGWIRDAFRRNLPYDEFVRRIVTAQGSTFQDGAATIFRDRREPEEIAPMVSQLFLGIRLECAKCHHHPFESWGQEQFYEFAAYFARVGRKGTGLSPPISGGEEIVYTARSGSVTHPLTGATLPPRPLFGRAPVPDDPEVDPREGLADWMTGPENPYFARVIANRVWADLMGRGIVEPVDDLRATNPPSNGPLLEALADDFRRHGFDLKHLIRTIATSTVYGLASEPNERNVADTRNFSRHYRQRLRAEVLLDAVSDITEVPERFEAAPPRSRATTIWTHRVGSLFLDTFGRPDPNQDPPCERTADTSVVQALHLMNAPGLNEKLTGDDGRVARLARGDRAPREVVEELYLLAYSRLPTEEERAIAEGVFAAPGMGRREAIADLLWALINSAEFVFKD
jgi:hypothetical protein